MDTIYYHFRSFYGDTLHDFLAGFDCSYNHVPENNQFVNLGIYTLLCSTLCVILFYYIINHPRFNRLWSWVIMLIIVFAVSVIIGYDLAYTDLNNGAIPNCFLVNENGEYLIKESHCWYLGVANGILSVVAAITLSFTIKWGSRNCKNTPC